MDARAILDHYFLVAAYVVTWTLQLGYLGWIAVRWQSLKKADKRRQG
jgi:hypothetical protein